jgi:DNA mismatch repair protein MSH2
MPPSKPFQFSTLESIFIRHGPDSCFWLPATSDSTKADGSFRGATNASPSPPPHRYCVVRTNYANIHVGDAKKIELMLENHRIEMNTTKRSAFGLQDMEQDLCRLLGSDQEAFQGDNEQNLAMGSIACLIKQCDLLSEDSSLGSYVLETGQVDTHMKLDGAATKALNLMPDPQFPDPNGSIFGILNKVVFAVTLRFLLFISHLILAQCKSPIGKRLLQRWVRQPLVNLDEINQRHVMVELFSDPSLHDDLRESVLKVRAVAF